MRRVISIFLIITAAVYYLFRWWGFLLIFPWIGAAIVIGQYADLKYPRRKIGRRLSISLIAPIFLIFLGVYQRENLQLEETVFYLYAGVFSRVLIHYSIAKILGPLFFGRGFCGWACWTAAALEWLPIAGNEPIGKRLTYLRFPVLFVSLLIPFILIRAGYDYQAKHINEALGKWSQFIWFCAGNAVYYLAAVFLAFAFNKKRAFCKIICPVSLVMKIPSKFSIWKYGPAENECRSCGSCGRNCPMDVDVMAYISNKRRITDSECINCGECERACAFKAIAFTKGSPTR